MFSSSISGKVKSLISYRTDGYDIIGDIHGDAEMLEALLKKLGYFFRSGTWTHPGRKAIFVGDFINRGSGIRKVLSIIYRMVHEETAFCVAGNHEYQLLRFLTMDDQGHFMSPHHVGEIARFSRTFQDFRSKPAELGAYLEWFLDMPLYLDFEDIRVVHACWDPEVLKLLGEVNSMRSFFDSGGKDESLRKLIEICTHGPEIRLPKAQKGRVIRVKWWQPWKTGQPARHYIASGAPRTGNQKELLQQIKRNMRTYKADQPPLFIGHYSYQKPHLPLAPNLICLDFGISKFGVLGAYRWNGEDTLTANKIVSVSSKESR